MGEKTKWLNTQWSPDNSTDGTNGGKYTKSDKIILCKARSQEMVHDFQPWKVNTVHSLCNYTLFEHVPFLCSLAFFVIYGTGVLLSVFPWLQHEVEGKKKSAADMPCSSSARTHAHRHTHRILHAVGTVSITSEEAVCYSCSEGYSVSKTVPADALSAPCENISSAVDREAALILSTDAQSASQMWLYWIKYAKVLLLFEGCKL